MPFPARCARIEVRPKGETLVIYTKSDCQPCRLTKAALARKGITFTERNVEEDPDAYAEVKALGYLAVPVVVTEDDHWQGLRPDKIAALV